MEVPEESASRLVSTLTALSPLGLLLLHRSVTINETFLFLECTKIRRHLTSTLAVVPYFRTVTSLLLRFCIGHFEAPLHWCLEPVPSRGLQ